MKIAVTGAGGFLGTELLRQLAGDAEITVYAFTFSFERERSTYVTAKNIISVDNSEAGTFDYTGVDVLVNCAFPRNVSDETFAQGLDFIQQVLVKAAADGVGSVINISSQSVYSQVRTAPATEAEPIILESKYAVGKYWSELFVNTVCSNIRHTNLRMASLIGAGFNQRIVNKFAMKVRNGEDLTITGGDQQFGFLDVRDAASGILALIRSEGAWDPVYNLGTNRSYTLQEIAETVLSVGKTEGYTTSVLHVEEGGVWQNSSLCCDKLMEAFQWQPVYTLEGTTSNIFHSLG